MKLAIATREEMGDYIRSFSEAQFSKDHQAPEVRAWLVTSLYSNQVLVLNVYMVCVYFRMRSLCLERAGPFLL